MVDAKTMEEKTPLDIALEQHGREVIKLLLKNRAAARGPRENANIQR